MAGQEDAADDGADAVRGHEHAVAGLADVELVAGDGGRQLHDGVGEGGQDEAVDRALDEGGVAAHVGHAVGELP